MKTGIKLMVFAMIFGAIISMFLAYRAIA